MKKEELQDYIGSLLNEYETWDFVKEIPSLMFVLRAYILGLGHKEITLDSFLIEPELEDFPARFHTLIAQLAILKGKKEKSPKIKEYLEKTVEMLLKELREYLVPLT